MRNTLTAISNKATVTIGVASSFIINMMGGWGQDIQTLLIFMTIDYIMGVSNAVLYKTSPKSENGALNSKVGLIGICKKIMLLTMVIVGHRIDITFGFDYVRGGVCVTLIINELVSMMETWKLSGIKTPQVINDIIDVINKK